MSSGHDETVRLVEDLLTRFEGPRSARARAVSPPVIGRAQRGRSSRKVRQCVSDSTSHNNGCRGTSWSSRVQFAEDLGFDGAWGFDHFEPMYGSGPGETFEGMTTLAALSGQTSRIRLGLLVTGVTYRHPSVLAAQAVTVDHASHGRLELALGAAWFDKEHNELGIPFPPTSERFDLLEDALEIMTRLFTGEVVSYEGKVVSLHDAQMRPVPVQQPHPPIWIGGSGPRRTLPLVARYADVWHSWGTPNSLQETNRMLDELASAAGRESIVDHAGELALARRPRDRAQARGKVARRRLRVPGLWMAGRGQSAGRAVRPRGPARFHRVSLSFRLTRRSGQGRTRGRAG